MSRKTPPAPTGDPVVFISSTDEDLRPFRAAAEEPAKRAGFSPEMMEYFGASGRPSLDECLERVSRAHVVVAITAHRYDWIPDIGCSFRPRPVNHPEHARPSRADTLLWRPVRPFTTSRPGAASTTR